MYVCIRCLSISEYSARRREFLAADGASGRRIRLLNCGPANHGGGGGGGGAHNTFIGFVYNGI